MIYESRVGGCRELHQLCVCARRNRGEKGAAQKENNNNNTEKKISLKCVCVCVYIYNIRVISFICTLSQLSHTAKTYE